MRSHPAARVDYAGCRRGGMVRNIGMSRIEVVELELK